MHHLLSLWTFPFSLWFSCEFPVVFVSLETHTFCSASELIFRFLRRFIFRDELSTEEPPHNRYCSIGLTCDLVWTLSDIDSPVLQVPHPWTERYTWTEISHQVAFPWDLSNLPGLLLCANLPTLRAMHICRLKAYTPSSIGTHFKFPGSTYCSG